MVKPSGFHEQTQFYTTQMKLMQEKQPTRFCLSHCTTIGFVLQTSNKIRFHRKMCSHCLI